MFSKKKNKTKIQPTDDSTEDVPDELEVKESCMKKCCRSIVTPRHCARRICEDVKGATGPFAKVQVLIEIPAKITALAAIAGLGFSFLITWVFAKRMSFTYGQPFPMYLEGGCLCNGQICDDVMFTFNMSQDDVLWNENAGGGGLENYLQAWRESVWFDLDGNQNGFSVPGGTSTGQDVLHFEGGDKEQTMKELLQVRPGQAIQWLATSSRDQKYKELTIKDVAHNCSDHGYDWEGGKVWVDGATNTTCVRNVTLTVMDVKQIVAVGVYAAPASDADTPIVKIIFDNTLVELILDPKSTPPIYLRSSICGQGPHQFVSRSGFRGDISYQGVVELDTLSVGRNLTVISDCDPLDKTCSEYFEGQKVNGSDPTVVGGANGTAANGTAGEGEFGTRRQRRLLRYRSMATEEEEAKDVEDQNDQNDQNEEPQPAEINAVVNAVVVRSDRRRLNDSTTSSSSNASSTNSSFLSCVEVDLTMPKVEYLWNNGASGHCRDDTPTLEYTKKLNGAGDLNECLSRCFHYGNSSDIGTPGVRGNTSVVVVGCEVVQFHNDRTSLEEGCFVNFNKQAFDDRANNVFEVRFDGDGHSGGSKTTKCYTLLNNPPTCTNDGSTGGSSDDGSTGSSSTTNSTGGSRRLNSTTTNSSTTGNGHWAVPGSPDSQNSKICGLNSQTSLNDQTLGVTCCDSGDAQSSGSRPGCESALNYEDAKNHCSDQNKQLCTVAQLENGAGKGSGCGFDGKLVWSKDQCTAAAGSAGSASTTQPPCETLNVKSFCDNRCCAVEDRIACTPGTGGGEVHCGCEPNENGHFIGGSCLPYLPRPLFPLKEPNHLGVSTCMSPERYDRWVNSGATLDTASAGNTQDTTKDQTNGKTNGTSSGSGGRTNSTSSGSGGSGGRRLNKTTVENKGTEVHPQYGPLSACLLGHDPKQTCDGSGMADLVVCKGFDIVGAEEEVGGVKAAVCKTNKFAEFSVLQNPFQVEYDQAGVQGAQGDLTKNRRSLQDDSCWVSEWSESKHNALAGGSGAPKQNALLRTRYEWVQENEPTGWRGNNLSTPYMGAPRGWGGKNGVGEDEDIDVTTVRQKYTQAWGNREQFDSLKVNLIGGLMGLLCAFIGFMDFTSNFVPEEHPLIESCNIKAILRSLVVKVLCPCISPKKKKLEPPKKNEIDDETKAAVSNWEFAKDDAKDVVTAATVGAAKDAAKAKAKEEAMKEMAKVVPGLTGCQGFCAKFDDGFAYVFITLPFNFLIACYTTVGASLLSNINPRADGAGIWLLGSAVAGQMVNLPFIFGVVILVVFFVIAPTWGYCKAYKDLQLRTQQNILCKNRKRAGKKVIGPVIIKKRKEWLRWKRQRPKIGGKGCCKNKVDLEFTDEYKEGLKKCKNSIAVKIYKKREFGDCTATYSSSYCREMYTAGATLFIFMVWMGISGFIFYHQFKDLFANLNLEIKVPSLSFGNLVFGIPLDFKTFTFAVPGAQIPIAACAFAYSSLKLLLMASKIIRGVQAKFGNLFKKMCGCLCKAKAAVENVPSVEEMAEMAAPAEEEAPAEEAPAEEAPVEEAPAEGDGSFSIDAGELAAGAAERAAKAAADKAEQRINEKIDEKINAGIDKVMGEGGEETPINEAAADGVTTDDTPTDATSIDNVEDDSEAAAETKDQVPEPPPNAPLPPSA